MRDPYTILGLSSAADARTVRRAYKKLAVQFHPDRNSAPDAATRFKEVAEAYAVLTNERERKRYARRRHREHAEREQRRQQAAAAARQRAARQRSAAATAAEQVFWNYARQVRERRTGGQSHSRQRATKPTFEERNSQDRWWDHLGALAAISLMAIYLWRSGGGLPLQPWLPGSHFGTHALTSPIWITLSLSLLMIVKPRWFLVSLFIDRVRDVRLGGWTMVLLFPFISAAGPELFPLFR